MLLRNLQKKMPTLSTINTQLKGGVPGYTWGAQAGDAVLALHLLPLSGDAPAQRSRQNMPGAWLWLGWLQAAPLCLCSSHKSKPAKNPAGF